ncbi:MAG: FAD-dependent oxidoreductase [Aromatoleum sp.]|jgi:NADPH-dependent 2,4-dienoyl-CoA reductase/sulfur reductase-like enzyme/nitrite reductase/ring-hydroxylating ferredoxin subunit|uniref:FAD-dependent oxidoreductase n=1 Tax=Aromatoleum sp. TaxID=2307007 RepID=UPI0028955C4B|nr:FAD-dependent oxidoreductase [Aromatoleum sp.]MDT3669428.1 FAD-dependent oxidoreductase [Aromatoleum sp.]
MSDEKPELVGPDLCQGVPASSLTDGQPLLGHAQGEPVIVVRRGDEFFAVGAVCTHYSGPLAEGIVVGDTVRCPWHHAAFCLRTGEAVRAPALDPVPCRRVELRDGLVIVGEKIEPVATSPAPAPSAAGLPEAIVIIGGGAAGNAAAEMLRREQFDGTITMLSADDSLPCDRPNLSKNYLAGSAPEEWISLRSAEFYHDRRIDLKLNARVVAIDTAKRELRLEDGSHHRWDALLLATGAEPVKLDVPGAGLPHVHVLRTWADSRALVAGATKAKKAVIVGASFIGLEVASSLRARDIDVQVIGRETVLMERVLGAEVGSYLRQMHEEHGVRFHLGATVASIDERAVTLANGEVLEADLVVVGIGVRPALALAEQAGLAIDRGVSVDRYLATNVAGIYAAGDIARWPDRLSGAPIRVEHWVVAERQGQVAARNMLGRQEPFDMVPFFWTEQYDFGLAYVGHAEGFDRVDIEGSLAARDCKLSYSRGGKKLAVAVVHRDREGLRCELEFEREFERAPAADA